MKTREELAKEFTESRARGSVERWTTDGKRHVFFDLDEDTKDGYLAGFDAGFARAAEMLRSDEAKAKRLHDVKNPWDWADWLEQQQKAEDKK